MYCMPPWLHLIITLVNNMPPCLFCLLHIPLPMPVCHPGSDSQHIVRCITRLPSRRPLLTLQSGQSPINNGSRPLFLSDQTQSQIPIPCKDQKDIKSLHCWDMVGAPNLQLSRPTITDRVCSEKQRLHGIKRSTLPHCKKAVLSIWRVGAVQVGSLTVA